MTFNENKGNKTRDSRQSEEYWDFLCSTAETAMYGTVLTARATVALLAIKYAFLLLLFFLLLGFLVGS